MSIGIEDADFSQYIIVPFNIDAMKISAYYKRKGEIVVLAPSFTPERHQKFFYRKDYDDGSFPPTLTTEKNVEYGGYAFSNNRYIPLPMEIERMHPDSSLYERMRNLVMQQKHTSRKKIFQNMIEAEHCRLSLDDKTIWPDFERQFHYLPTCRNLMIHDFDLGKVEGSFEAVKYILSKTRTDGWATKVGMKFPIVISTGAELLDWSSLNSNSTFYSLQYEGVIDSDTFMKWIGKCRQRAVYSQMTYHVTSSRYSENHFINDLLLQIYKQVIISRSFRIFFSLTYDDGFFSDPYWGQVLRLINYYMNSLSGAPTPKYIRDIADDTMYNFAKHSGKVEGHKYAHEMTRPEIREVFAFVRENNYPLFQAFYECSYNSLGGKL